MFVNFAKHQRIRSLHQRKTPPPPEEIFLPVDKWRHLTSNGRGILLPPLVHDPVQLARGGEGRVGAPGRSFIERVLEAYGPERMIWGSDFPPVCGKETVSMTLETVRTWGCFSEAELEWVLGKSAMAILEF